MEARKLLRMDESRYQRLRREAAKEPSALPTAELTRELEHFDAAAENLLQVYERAGIQVWGVFHDLTLAGVVAVSPVQFAGNQRHHWLWGLYVHPRFRGTPVSRSLMATAQDWSERENSSALLMGAYQCQNRHAAQLVERFGFQLSPQRDEAELVGLLAYDEIMVECSTRYLHRFGLRASSL